MNNYIKFDFKLSKLYNNNKFSNNKNNLGGYVTFIKFDTLKVGDKVLINNFTGRNKTQGCIVRLYTNTKKALVKLDDGHLRLKSYKTLSLSRL